MLDAQVIVTPHALTVAAIGQIVQALFVGGLVTLGVTCLFLLSQKRHEATTQKRFWQVYITVLMLANLVFLVASALLFNDLINSIMRPVGRARASALLSGAGTVLIASLTDGVLVWRCYVIQNTFSRSRSKLQNIFWVFPLCLWISMLVAGSIEVGLTSLGFAAGAFDITALMCNVTLNLFATIYITARLVLYRRVVTIRFGSKTPPVQYLRIVTILLESAMINVPTSLAAAIGILLKDMVGTTFLLITVCCQSFASILILHQVTLGRALEQQKGEPGVSGEVMMPTNPPNDIVLNS